jgi:trk system potassium uptake protein TrkH
MIAVRPVLYIVGWLLVVLAAVMVVAGLADAVAGNGEWRVFAISAGLTAFIGLMLVLGTRSPEPWSGLSVRQIFLATALGWLVPCAFAALPFAFGASHLSAVDAVFEATCGLTTTGASLLGRLHHLPPGLMLWRGLLQWVGGIGTLVTVVAVLPPLRVGGMQIFRIEMLAPGGRASPRATWIAGTLTAIYSGLTLALAALLWAAGLPGFAALMQSMASLSTGGFAVWGTTLGPHADGWVELASAFGMVLGGLPFLAYLQLAQGRVGAVLRDGQVRWYLGIMAAAALVLALWLWASQGVGLAGAVRDGAFTVVSTVTGTGFFADSAAYHGLPEVMLVFLALLGGCAGSTTGGIKIFRLRLLLTDAAVQMRRSLRPHAVLIASFNRQPIPQEALESVMGYLYVYALAFAALAAALGLFGLDLTTALSGAAGAIANAGIGLGPVIGQPGGLAALPDGAKWVLAGGMVFGRVEMFPLLVLVLPGFWRE